MGFVERELSKISDRLHGSCNNMDSDTWKKLWAAQQALTWALDPTNFQAPFDAITGEKTVPSVSLELEPSLPKAEG